MLLKNAVIVITGAKGVGKTVLASTYARPSEVGLVYYDDSERSANRIVQSMAKEDLAFGYYGDLSNRFSDLPSDADLLTQISKGKLPWLNKEEKGALCGYYEYIRDTLDKNLELGKYKVYVMDTLEKFEAGMAAWVENRVDQWGYRSLRDAMKFGRFWSDCVYSLYEQFFAAVFARGVETIILCSHLGTPWRDKKPVPGKVNPHGKPLLRRLSSIMIWLVSDSSNADGAPAGLILKERTGKMEVDLKNDRWLPRTMLPRRIPHCTWDDVRRYLTDGCDLSKPAKGEVMSSFERDMISELLTDKQMELMVLDAKNELAEKNGYKSEQEVTLPQEGAVFSVPATLTPAQEWVIRVKKMITDGVSIQDARAKIVSSYPPPLRKTKGEALAAEVMSIVEAK